MYRGAGGEHQAALDQDLDFTVDSCWGQVQQSLWNPKKIHLKKRWDLHLFIIHFVFLSIYLLTSSVVENLNWDWEVVGFTPDWLAPKVLEGLDHGASDSWEEHSCCLLFPQALVKCGKQISHLGMWQPVPFFQRSLWWSHQCFVLVALFLLKFSVFLLHVTIFSPNFYVSWCSPLSCYHCCPWLFSPDLQYW